MKPRAGKTRRTSALQAGPALRLGYAPAGACAETVGAEIGWLVEEHRAGRAVTMDDACFAPFLDYAADDAWLSSGRRA